MKPVSKPKPDDFVPVDLPGFERSQLFAFVVGDEHANQAYPPGTRVIVGPRDSVGVREDSLVVVERVRDEEVETTIRKVVIERDGQVSLAFHSDDKRFKDKIWAKDVGVSVLGVVLAGLNIAPQPLKPLIQI